MVSTSLKRSFLDDAWDAAKAVSQSSPDLRAQLRSNETGARKNIAGGTIASVTANGRSTTFASPGPRSNSPDDIREAWRDLVDLYDQCAIDLESTAPAIIYTEMMSRLVDVTEFQSDYSEAGCYR